MTWSLLARHMYYGVGFKGHQPLTTLTLLAPFRTVKGQIVASAPGLLLFVCFLITLV